MIEFVQGDLLEAQADALVNAVNTGGVMGKLDVRPAARQLLEEGGELSGGADQTDSSDSSEEMRKEQLAAP